MPLSYRSLQCLTFQTYQKNINFPLYYLCFIVINFEFKFILSANGI